MKIVLFICTAVHPVSCSFLNNKSLRHSGMGVCSYDSYEIQIYPLVFLIVIMFILNQQHLQVKYPRIYTYWNFTHLFISYFLGVKEYFKIFTYIFPCLKASWNLLQTTGDLLVLCGPMINSGIKWRAKGFLWRNKTYLCL